MMCDLLHHQSAPEVETETFRGDPLEYHYFILVFREVVELKIDDQHGRLVQLLKYIEDETRDIRQCIQQTPEAAVGKTWRPTSNFDSLQERDEVGHPWRIVIRLGTEGFTTCSLNVKASCQDSSGILQILQIFCET